MSDTCQGCGASPAEGWATVNGRRYCHGETKRHGRTCYEWVVGPGRMSR